MKYVSVPLRGLWFLSYCLLEQGKVKMRLFPSPCGDYGSYHFRCYITTGMILSLFPSPCGDYGSYQHTSRDDRTLTTSVSVPLRGLWFLSKGGVGRCIKVGPKSFRPLAGIMVLIISRVHQHRQKTKFPSPCGDYGSYRSDSVMAKIEQEVSVPLRGLWFLSKPLMIYVSSPLYVSVPLRGLWFLSFRQVLPLPTSGGIVSVPLRGLWFLSIG